MNYGARTQFDYLLNAFECAARADEPAKHGYAEARKELFAYVRDLERRAERQAARHPHHRRIART